MKSGGYMHHFTLRKMKYKQPNKLSGIIERFVINSDKPSIIAPKQRAARGSRKRRDHMNFTRNQLERMLNIARLAGDKEIITILMPKKILATCKESSFSRSATIKWNRNSGIATWKRFRRSKCSRWIPLSRNVKILVSSSL